MCCILSDYLGGGFNYFVHLYLGKIPIVTNIFQLGWSNNKLFIDQKPAFFVLWMLFKTGAQLSQKKCALIRWFSENEVGLFQAGKQTIAISAAVWTSTIHLEPIWPLFWWSMEKDLFNPGVWPFKKQRSDGLLGKWCLWNFIPKLEEMMRNNFSDSSWWVKPLDMVNFPIISLWYVGDWNPTQFLWGVPKKHHKDPYY